MAQTPREPTQAPAPVPSPESKPSGQPPRPETLLHADPAARIPQPQPPRFSQPVRQIVLMLAVLAAVGAGAWLIYGPLHQIFLANRWLNGAILAVFAAGVLGCFLQVAQLVASVSWIERFARRDPDARRAAPRLLAPLAALLGGPRPAVLAISPSSARSILDSVGTRLDEVRDITRYLGNLLIFLGLLGTFYGLATTVPGVVDTIRALAPQEGETAVQMFDKLMAGLETQLGGMGTAFSSSLLGLAGSLVVGLLELFVTHGQNRFYRELEEWLTGFTRLGLAGGDEGADQAALVGALDQIGAHVLALSQVQLARDAELSQADRRVADLAAMVAQMAEGQGARDAALNTALTRMTEATEAQSAAARDLIETSGGFDDPEARMRLRSIDTQMERLAEDLGTATAGNMAELRAELHSLIAAVQALGGRR